MRAKPINDSIRNYLNSLGDCEFFDKDREIELSRAYLAGDAARQKLAHNETRTNGKRLSESKVAELTAAVREGESAGNQLIHSMLPYVVSIAKRYRHRSKAHTLLDCIQAGNMGVLRAIQKFDPERGFRLTTYATWWIRQSIQRMILQESSLIAVPVGAEDRNYKSHAIKARRLMSLDVPYTASGSDDPGTLLDFQTDHREPPPPIAAAHNEELNRLRSLYKWLTPTERSVIEFCSIEGMTLEEAGARMHITRERVRQLQVKAFRRLRFHAERLGFVRKDQPGEKKKKRMYRQKLGPKAIAMAS
jgi:RNA polymerase primary sigma factor